jgi:hypothetical protein
MIVLLIITILYGISILRSVKNDLKKINGTSLNQNKNQKNQNQNQNQKDDSNYDTSDMKELIDNVKYGLEYLKKFL